MLLKRRVMSSREKDEISEALAFTETPEGGTPYRVVPAYIYNYYPKGLKELCLGPYSKGLLGVTRFYPTYKPQIVVDFEPPRPDPWFVDEKRKFFSERGIAYVAIPLNAQMSTEQFQRHVEASIRLVTAVQKEAKDLEQVLTLKTDVEEWLQTPEVLTSLHEEAVQLFEEEQAARVRAAGRPFHGIAVVKRTQTIKEQLMKKLREDLKSGRVVDPLRRHPEPATTT